MISRFRVLLISDLRFSPFDTSTAEGRSRERHRRVLLTGITALLAKIVAVSTSLITIPITLHYLGTERFGLWMTISSVVAILGFADFGIGNGVLNAVAEAHGKDDSAEIRRSVTSAFLLLTGIAALLLCFFAAIYRHIDWGQFFNVSSQLARNEAGPATAVFIVCFVLNIPADIVQRLQLGLQEGFVSKLWQLGGSLAGLAGVLSVVYLRLGLPWLLLALAGAPLVVTIANNVVFFGWMRPDLRPNCKLVSYSIVHKIAKLGALFFILQGVVAIAYSADNFIVARLLGPEAVTRYSITAKMFSVISLGLSMFLAPLWPAYGEAVARGDLQWVKRTLIKSTAAASLIAAIIGTVFVIFGPAILRVWVHRTIAPSFSLLLGLALWATIDAAGQSISMFLNGANIILPQVVIACVFAVGCLGLKLFFVQRFGITGVPWATLLSYIFLSVVPCMFIIPRAISFSGNNSPNYHKNQMIETTDL